jgi:hypothetical protein
VLANRLIMTAEEYEDLPKGIKDITDSWDDNKDLYAECNRIQKELEQKGWTCDYGLDGMVYDVKKVNVC